LDLEDCEGALLEGCTFTCASPTSDMAPYPPSHNLAAAISCRNSTVQIKSCSISAPGLDARGLVVEGGSLVEVTDSGFSGTFNSAVWCHGDRSRCSLSRVSVKQCGGYGALYCSHAGLLEAALVEEEGNPRGCGVFVLHSGSRTVLDSSRFDGNKWSGFGCRWSGGGGHKKTERQKDKKTERQKDKNKWTAGGVEGGPSPTAHLTQMDRAPGRSESQQSKT